MPKRNNILFLMTDQHRVDTLGCYGNQVVHTPALDELAATGVVFDRCYTPTAICTPARASLLTGLHPFEHGLLSNDELDNGHRKELPDDVATLPQTLRASGYRLGYVGKWHVGRERGPDYYGFDGVHLPGAFNAFDHASYRGWLDERGFPPPVVHDPIHTTRPDGTQGHLIAGRLAQPTEATFEAFLTDLTISKLFEFAESGDEAPFGLWCSFFGPHLPYLIPNDWYDRYDPADVELPASFAETFARKPAVQRAYSSHWGADGFDAFTWRKLIAVYWGYVAMIDQQIGQIVAALESIGMRDSTTIFFTADHGEFTGAHRLNSKGPAMYEDIYRIPAVIRSPDARPHRADEFVTLLDMTATILDLANADMQPCRGRSLMPLVRGEPVPDWPKQVVCEFHGLHFPYGQRMLRDDRLKLVVNAEGVDELYDLTVDPDELVNLIDDARYEGAVGSMRRRLYDELLSRDDAFATWVGFMRDRTGESVDR